MPDDEPTLADIDYDPPKQRSLDEGDPCPECGYEFDSGEWDVRKPPSGPTIGEDWYYTCPNCEQETCWIGT